MRPYNPIRVSSTVVPTKEFKMPELKDAMPVDTGQRLEAKVTFDVRSKDGSQFFDAVVSWHDFPYAGVVLLQRELVDVLSKLTSFGEAAVVQTGNVKK